MNESSPIEKTDYQKTLNLPQTDFSMKADLTRKEPIIRAQWAKLDLYHEILKKNHGKTKYILHDGPPYANGNVHIGTALNKILKDIVVKFKSMQGFYSPFIPGWDCHGLPIEHKVINELGDKAKTSSQTQIRQECEAYARRFIDIQRKQFQALGILGDWDNPYLTLNPSYEAGVIDVFHDLVKNGYIYRKLRPIHWCMHCETVLAEAELEYSNETSPSIYVKFPLNDTQIKEVAAKTNLPPSTFSLPLSFFIWTTTPWTLPANVAVALNPAFEYALVSTGNDILIMAAGLVEKVVALLNITDYKILNKVKGAVLEGLTYNHPFIKERLCQVILADYVSLEDGTGIVHIAPGHGIDDYESGLKYNLPVISPVDKGGRFTAEAGVFPGERVFAADPKICQMLDEQKLLLKKVDLVHSYPHCWRCKKSLIFRATEQWFISVDNHSARQKAIAEVNKARWIPEWGKSRTASMLESRPDWCVSRQRNWGVPIPVFYCAKCNQSLLDVAVITHVRDIFAKEGANAWFSKSAAELMPAGAKCKCGSPTGQPCGSTEFSKENDIFDVWFESGSSFRSVVIENKDLQFPADLYLEGSDQPARWFQLSLLPAVMTQGVAPFKNVLIHGFVKRPEGEKLSKSKGAMTSDEMVNKVGADIIRLWISSINFTDDIPISLEILQEKADPYRKIRNTFRYMMGNLYDYNPAADEVKYDQMLEIDRWALNKLHRLLDMTTQSYENFEFYKVFREVYEFCVVEMSSFYFDILKDRLYTFGAKSVERRSAQTALNAILQTLVRIIAPILSYTAEEIWSNILFVNAGSKTPDAKLLRSVHLLDWPKVDSTKIDNKLDENWKKIFLIRSEVTKQTETLRQAGQIGSSIEADVTLYIDGTDLLEFLKQYEKELVTILKVSSVKVIKKPAPQKTEGMQLGVEIIKSGNQKCARCWNYTADVGRNNTHPTLCGRCVGVVSAK
jgi:isoleucyl-tRNA synthetase